MNFVINTNANKKKVFLFCHFFTKQAFLLSKNQIFGINIHLIVIYFNGQMKRLMLDSYLPNTRMLLLVFQNY